MIEMEYRNEHYRCTCGQLRWRKESEADAIDHEKMFHGYCGTCKAGECLVETGQACCHDMVKYGRCTKHARPPQPRIVDRERTHMHPVRERPQRPTRPGRG